MTSTVHGDCEKDEMEIPRKLSYISSTSEDQTNAASKFGMLTLKIMKENGADEEPSPATSDSPMPAFSIGKIYKNLFILSLAFVLMFTAYNGMVTLQSSLNTKGNVGVNSLIITYAFLIVRPVDLMTKKENKSVHALVQFHCLDWRLYGSVWFKVHDPHCRNWLHDVYRSEY